MENESVKSESDVMMGLNVIYLVFNIICDIPLVAFYIFMLGWMGDGNAEYYFHYDISLIITLGIFFIIPPIIYAAANYQNLSKKNIVFVIINGLIIITQEILLDIFLMKRINWNDGLTIDYIFLILWTIGSIGLAISLLFFFKWKIPKEIMNKEKIEELQLYE